MEKKLRIAIDVHIEKGEKMIPFIEDFIWKIAEEIESLTSQLEEYKEFAEFIAENYDCKCNETKFSDSCIVCRAEGKLSEAGE